jgi:hypothetical protein
MNRRDVGIAFLGAAAGIAGCSQPAKSLFVPEADAANAANAVTPATASAHWFRIHQLRVNSSFDVYLIPHEAEYWIATSSHPHIAAVDESFLPHAFLNVNMVGTGDATIHLTGKNGETLAVRVNVV